jgi:hypothetical protein
MRDLLYAVHGRIIKAKGPNRDLDRAVASTLSPRMIWRGRPLGTRHLSMAFTRGVENAERLVLIALPGWEWSVGSNFIPKGMPYYANLWGPGDLHDDAGAETPALAILACAFACGIEEGIWPALATLSAGEVRHV